MTIIESIRKRRSVRTYTGEPLREAHATRVKQFITDVQPPFGVNARIELIQPDLDVKSVKLGTYGWIKGAVNYLVLIYEEAPFAATAAAYFFEQTVLFCTGLGLATCWIGGSFNRADFKKQLILQPGEKLKIVSPIGYEHAQKRWFLEKVVVNAEKKHASRKPFEALFFDCDFTHPLHQADAGDFATVLEMVRLAPSANNWQEWRVVRDGNRFHFYRTASLFADIDIGIALCHFELTANELGIHGRFEPLNEHPENDKAAYVISWIQN
ncbi:MAG: hypothetical protein LBR67_08870 [Dysgonamonadaceae bacterium]|jgi:nitroreductase|nr:hypothetical protein [Dysgonamonadaceae bacterium]